MADQEPWRWGWEIHHCLEDLVPKWLELGWEPFAVTMTTHGQFMYHLRLRGKRL